LQQIPACKIMLRLLKMVVPVLPTMLFSISMGILGYLSGIGMMVGSALLIAEALGMNSVFASGNLTMFVVSCAVLRGILRYLEQYSGHDVAFRLLALVREQIFAALRRLAPAKLIEKRSGDLVATVLGDVEYIEVFFAHTIAPVVIGTVVPVIVLIFIGRYWLGFALILLLFQLGVGLFLPLFSFRLGKTEGRQYRNRLAEVHVHLLDSLRGLKELLLFNRGAERLAEIRSKGRELNRSYSQLKRHEGLVMAVADLLVLSAVVTLLFSGIGRFEAGLIGVGELFIVTVTASSSFAPLLALSALSNSLMQTFAAAERIFALLDEEEPIREKASDWADEAIVNPGDLAYYDVGFSYPEKTVKVLKNLNFAIKPGQQVALVGKSGSGKSTVLRLLLRFWDVSEGKITVDERDIRDISLFRLRFGMALMAQDTYLFNETIAANIRIGKPDATDEEIEAAARKAAIHDFITKLPKGYQTNVGELGSRLSGGERQRIGLARAFVKDAPLMLLDEPTSNLDTLNEQIILKAIKEECQEKTVVTVSHRPTAVAAAERILTLEDGRISES
jgi:ATP-binding cassette subfamily C protein